MSLDIREVTDKRGLNTFIRVPDAIYADDPNYVTPLDMERKQLLDQKHNPYFDHAEVKLWIAYKDGKPVGRISAQVCELVQAQIQKDLGQFGMFECIDDMDVANALFDTAEAWLKDMGMTHIGGPYNLSVNQECGLLIDGFDTPNMVLMGHARPYYAKMFEDRGFQKAKDLYAYYLNIVGGLPERTNRIIKLSRRNKHITLRQLREAKFTKELARCFEIFNAAWAGNWGFVPFTHDELTSAAKEIRQIIRKDFVYIAEYDGEPAAFMVTIPNLNDWIADLNGKLFPFGWAKLLWRMKFAKPVRTRVPLMGVLPEYQKTPAGAAMALQLIEACRKNAEAAGCEYGELGWILEDNQGMRSILEQIGSHIYKTYRLYQKAL